MAKFEVRLVVDDTVGDIPQFWFTAADGSRVTCARVGDALQFAADYAFDPTRRGLLIPTISQRVEAEVSAVTLPEGWEVTLDGYNQAVADGVVSTSRTYRRVEDGLVVTAPCAGDGGVTGETVAVLGAVEPVTATEEPVAS